MLTATFVRTVNVPGRYGDGRGGLRLTLLVQPSSRQGLCKSSRGQSVRIGSRRTTIGLGRYPSLPWPRPASWRSRTPAINEGRDPRQTSTTVPTFAKALESVIAIHAENGRTAPGPNSSGGRTCATTRCHAWPTSPSTRSTPPTSGRYCSHLVHQAGDRQACPAVHRRGDEVGGRTSVPAGRPGGRPYLGRAAEEHGPATAPALAAVRRGRGAARGRSAGTPSARSPRRGATARRSARGWCSCRRLGGR